MTVDTHCLPAGSLATHEIPVSPINAGTVWASSPPGVGIGRRRGVVVSMGGLPLTATAEFVTPTAPVDSGPPTPSDFVSYGGTFAAQLALDGWIVLDVAYPEASIYPFPVNAIFNDVVNDSGHGSRYLATQLHWWQHIVEYIRMNYGPLPIVAFGRSWGGWHVLQIAANRQQDLLGYIAGIPATIVENVNPAFTGTANFNATNTSGLDCGPTLLNACNVPGLVSYGTSDEAVGWQATASAPGVQPINSNTDLIITNAIAAGMPVTRNETADFHQFTSLTVGTTASSGGLLSALGTLPVATSLGLTSGGCSVLAEDGNWYIISFTSNDSTANVLHGCTFTGPGNPSAVAAAAGTLVCASGTGHHTSPTPAQSPMALLYYVKTVLDPIAPEIW